MKKKKSVRPYICMNVFTNVHFDHIVNSGTLIITYTNLAFVIRQWANAPTRWTVLHETLYIVFPSEDNTFHSPSCICVTQSSVTAVPWLCIILLTLPSCVFFDNLIILSSLDNRSRASIDLSSLLTFFFLNNSALFSCAMLQNTCSFLSINRSYYNRFMH